MAEEIPAETESDEPSAEAAPDTDQPSAEAAPHAQPPPLGGANGAELPSAEEAMGWAGAKLDEIAGTSVGRVEGVYVDAVSAEPRWLLVRMGRFGHHSAVPFSHAVAGVGRVWAPYDREMVRQAPRVDAGQPFSREQELELCRFYGMGENVGRGAEIAERPEGSVTARPAEPAG